MSPDALFFAHRYVYTGSPVEVSLDVAHDLLRLADQYLLEGLKYLCECTIARVSEVAIFIYTLVCDLTLTK